VKNTARRVSCTAQAYGHGTATNPPLKCLSASDLSTGAPLKEASTDKTSQPEKKKRPTFLRNRCTGKNYHTEH